MKFYLVDDDIGVVSILSMIISDSGCGEICGSASNGADALEDLPHVIPDVVMVDLLMPEMDGIEFVRQAKKLFPQIAFIMLSHVTSKDMIAQAYESGVEFFISKPVNGVEILGVLRKVCRMLSMSRTFEQVHMLMRTEPVIPPPTSKTMTGKPTRGGIIARINGILQRLGISGDPAAREIAMIVEYLSQNGESDTPNVSALCAQFSDSPKSMEQRIRRAATAGLVNLANLGIEDYANEDFTELAGRLYHFEQIRMEMDFIRGRTTKRGKASLKKFLYALANICDN